MAGLEGTQLGNYELTERIGSGGMAEVYRAKQLTAFGREVAVKVIRQGFSEDKMFRERFLREAQAIAKLSHPNILPLIEFGEQGDILYLVMPYAPAGTLRDLIERIKGPLSLTDAIEIFTQLCDAVQYAHEQGIVHRDIKPQNVLIQRGKHLLLADFGIARDTNDQRLTMTGAGVGTVEYMAPEQAMGNSDTRSDLYSLGIVLYQMLTGRVPFSGSTPFEILMKQANQPLQPARTLNPSLPREVDGILEMALAKDPNKRFQSAAALQRAARGLLQPTHGAQVGTDLGTRAAPAPGGQISPDLETRSGPGPEHISSSRPGMPSSPGAPLPRGTTGSGSDFPPAVRSAGPVTGSSAGRGMPSPQARNDPPTRTGQRTDERGTYGSYGGNQPPAGWGGKPYTPSGPSYGDPYGNDATFATEAPQRRPTHPSSGGAPRRPGTRPPGFAPGISEPTSPPRRGNKWLLIAAVVLVIAALGVGGLAFAKFRGNTTANAPATAGSPGAGGGTPGKGATTTPTPPAHPSYAFMRNYQVFVSVHGQAPQQITNIPGVGQPNPSLPSYTVTDLLVSPLLFSPDGRYIAALIGINDAPRDGPIFGSLYIIDTQTKTVATPNEPGSGQLVNAQGGDNSLSWEDSHTLLFASDTNTVGVLAYDTTTSKVSVLFTPADGAVPVASVVVRSHYAFYTELIPRSGSSSYNLVLYQHDLSARSDKKLFTLGRVSAPEGPGASPDGYAPFDISPDSAHILWHGNQPGGSNDGIWYAKLDQSGLFQLFATVDLGQGSSNLQYQPTPLISPDGKKALLVTSTAVYTINVDGSNLKTYAYPDGQGAWLPDSSGITIAQITSSSGSPAYQTFQCSISTGGCSLFQDNAGPFYWSPT